MRAAAARLMTQRHVCSHYGMPRARWMFVDAGLSPDCQSCRPRLCQRAPPSTPATPQTRTRTADALASQRAMGAAGDAAVAAPTAATTTTPEVLLSVPAELHKVVGGAQHLVARGAFSVAIVSAAGEQRIEARVGDVAWPLSKALPALKAADAIFSFGLEHVRTEYLIVVLEPGTPADVLEAVDDVLHDCCAFSTVRQVDAAAEEVDKLQGGKQAQALQAAEEAGAGPAAAAGAATAAAAAAGAAAPGTAAPTPAGAAPAPPRRTPARIESGRYSLPSSGSTAADRVAAGLLWSGTVVANAVGSAATATAGAIKSYADKQKATGPPNEQHAQVSPHFKRGLAVAGVIASSAAYVTGKLAELVGHASYATALFVAKSLPGHSKRPAGAPAAASADIVTPEERGVLHTVGAAGLVAFVDVYDSLESACKLVFVESAEATQQYISYKYGPDAGQAAAKSVPVAQDMLTATLNFSRLGARAFVTKTAKASAKVYMKSTLAGIHPEQQAAGQRLPSFAVAPAAGAGAGGGASAAAAAAAASPSAAAAAAAAPAAVQAAAAAPASSSSRPSAYPSGSPARLAATSGGQQQGALNTAAAQQAARAAAPM